VLTLFFPSKGLAVKNIVASKRKKKTEEGKRQAGQREQGGRVDGYASTRSLEEKIRKK